MNVPPHSKRSSALRSRAEQNYSFSFVSPATQHKSFTNKTKTMAPQNVGKARDGVSSGVVFVYGSGLGLEFITKRYSGGGGWWVECIFFR